MYVCVLYVGGECNIVLISHIYILYHRGVMRGGGTYNICLSVVSVNLVNIFRVRCFEIELGSDSGLSRLNCGLNRGLGSGGLGSGLNCGLGSGGRGSGLNCGLGSGGQGSWLDARL